MSKYTVSIHYSASIDYDVEAENEDEALEIANDIEEPSDTFAEKILESIEYEDAFVRDREGVL